MKELVEVIAKNTLLIILKKSLLQKKKKENMLQLNFMWQHLIWER